MTRSDVSSGNKKKANMNPWSSIQHLSTRQYYFLSPLLLFVLFQCVYCMFQRWQYYPSPPHGSVCLVLENFYIYVSYFFVFLYGYLLHYVVYNTVVCINTIIYFSMGKKNIQRQITTSLETETPAY